MSPEPDFSLKAHDTASSIFATLEDADGTPVNIQGAAIRFRMAPIAGGTVTINDVATNAQNGAGTLDGSTGKVVYGWATVAGTAGLYLGEWQVTYSGGSIQTYPNQGFVLINIMDHL